MGFSGHSQLALRVVQVLAAIGCLALLHAISPRAVAQTATDPSSDCAPAAELKFICGMQRPEDLAHLPGTRWLIASGFDAGSGLKLVDTQAKRMRFWYQGAGGQIAPDRRRYPDCTAAPDVATFNVQGISLRPRGSARFTLFAANHGGREAIEVFDVDASRDEPLLSWRGCVLMPTGLAANSVSSTPDGTLLITVLSRPGTTYADFVNGRPTGAVYAWRPGTTGFQLLPGTELPGNNGIETSSDGKEFYVIAFGLHTVFAYSLADTSRPLRQAVAPGFMPDNLHWDGERLILAGMMYDEPACGGTRKVVNGVADPMRCHRGYVVAAMDPVSMQFTIMAYAPPNPMHNGLSTAVVIGRELWLGSWQSDRIAYRELPAP
jgi:hypothetical protein